MNYYSEAQERLKCCQNCSRSSSITTTAISPYWCSSYRRYVDPTGRCPLYIPESGYGDVNETKDSI